MDVELKRLMMRTCAYKLKEAVPSILHRRQKGPEAAVPVAFIHAKRGRECPKPEQTIQPKLSRYFSEEWTLLKRRAEQGSNLVPSRGSRVRCPP